ncbi:MAG: hypothetical protein QM771_18245 [Nitrospira sp.]
MIKMYRFLLFLLRDARTMMVLMVLTGLLAGLSSVGLLAVINKLINGAGTTSELFAAAFIGLAVLKVGSNYSLAAPARHLRAKDHLKIRHGSLLESGAGTVSHAGASRAARDSCDPDGRYKCPGLGGERVAGIGNQCGDSGAAARSTWPGYPGRRFWVWWFWPYRGFWVSPAL